MKINEIRPLESKFTEVLDTIALTPKMLYYYGKIPEKRGIVIAIVGTRKNTPYGKEVAYQLGYELGKRGAIIVSGLALGCDGIAHQGCLDAGGTTVAVLGTAINRLHPARHATLAEKIAIKGAVISEYAPDQPTHAYNFLERNRLISGLADAVIVVEANERSGSLNTAAHALAQGKDLWAVPADISRPLSRGCNQLIAKGANPVTSVQAVADAFFPSPKRKKSRLRSALESAETEPERKVLDALISGLRSGEDIIKASALTPAEFNQAITILEIRGAVKPLGLNNWAIL